MNYFTLVMDYLKKKELFCLRKGQDGVERFVFQGDLSPSIRKQYGYISLMNRKLGAERYQAPFHEFTFYLEREGGYCYIGLYRLKEEKPENRFCFAAEEWMNEI